MQHTSVLPSATLHSSEWSQAVQLYHMSFIFSPCSPSASKFSVICPNIHLYSGIIEIWLLPFLAVSFCFILLVMLLHSWFIPAIFKHLGQEFHVMKLFTFNCFANFLSTNDLVPIIELGHLFFWIDPQFLMQVSFGVEPVVLVFTRDGCGPAVPCPPLSNWVHKDDSQSGTSNSEQLGKCPQLATLCHPSEAQEHRRWVICIVVVGRPTQNHALSRFTLTVCSLNLCSWSQGSIAIKDSIIPRIPRQHYCSYGQIPLPPPFSFLSQDCPIPSPSGAPSYMLHCDTGSLDYGPKRRTSPLVLGNVSCACCKLTITPGLNLPSTIVGYWCLHGCERFNA